MQIIVAVFTGISRSIQHRNSNLIMLISGSATKSDIIPAMLIMGFHEVTTQHPYRSNYSAPL